MDRHEARALTPEEAKARLRKAAEALTPEGLAREAVREAPWLSLGLAAAAGLALGALLGRRPLRGALGPAALALAELAAPRLRRR